VIEHAKPRSCEHLAFLIDENLSPELARWAQARGLRALHATWARLPGKPGHQVTAYAVSGDFILVANNVDDFRMLYRRMEHHPGIIFLSVSDVDAMDRDAQRAMFEDGLKHALENEPLNEAITVLLELNVDGKWEVVVERELLARS
jgi:predicted nuclease of predicted toxin-antitoxin system